MNTRVETGILEIFHSIRASETGTGPDVAKIEIFQKGFDELGLDSLESMDLIMQIEEKYNIELDESDVLGCKNLADLAGLVQKLT